MRFHCMLLLIDIYLQTRVRAGVVGVGNSKIVVADTSTSQLISTDLGDVPVKRMLRYTDELDEERAGLPVSAAEKVTSSLASSEVTSSTLIRWINDKKSMDAVFTRLKLTNAGDKLFENPVFLTWLNYADELSAKLGKKTSPITTLTAQYGDETLSKMISAAKTVPATKDIATKMQVEQIQLWLRNGKSPVDVFKLLGLSTARNDLLASPELSTWTKYMKLFNNEYPEKKTTLIATLSTTYGDEAVSKILDAAKKVPSTERIATSLEKARLQYWFDQGKTIASVFTLLKLDKEGGNLLSSPGFTSWMKYVDEYHKKHRGMLIATGWVLRRHYKDDALARMVMIGRKSPNTKNAAQRLEDAIFRSWVNPPKLKEFSVQTPKRVFGLLKLDEAGDGVLQSPIFTFWTTYLDYFNKANPGKKESIISALTASYSDEALVQILESAKKVPSTEKLATKLQAETARSIPER